MTCDLSGLRQYGDTTYQNKDTEVRQREIPATRSPCPRAVVEVTKAGPSRTSWGRLCRTRNECGPWKRLTTGGREDPCSLGTVTVLVLYETPHRRVPVARCVSFYFVVPTPNPTRPRSSSFYRVLLLTKRIHLKTKRKD